MNYADTVAEKRHRSLWVTDPYGSHLTGHTVKTLWQRGLLELLEAIEEAEKDSTLIAFVIKGSEDSFCSGMDLKDTAHPEPEESIVF